MTAVLLAVSPAAQAQQITVTDDSGDHVGPGLDITRVTFANRDHAVVTKLAFARDTRSHVIVAIKARGGPFVGVVSRHFAQGPDNTVLRRRDYTKVPCEGLTSTWQRDAATLKLRMPARCLNGGNYGAIRAFALTETFRGTRDVDWAPERPDGDLVFTDWIPRG